MNAELLDSLAAKPGKLLPEEKKEAIKLPAFQPSSMLSANKGNDDLVSIMQTLTAFHVVWQKHLKGRNTGQTFEQWLKERGMLSL